LTVQGNNAESLPDTLDADFFRIKAIRPLVLFADGFTDEAGLAAAGYAGEKTGRMNYHL
jgi:hypothetical protein